LLAPIAALGLLPLATFTVRSPVRRAVQVAAAVLAAGIVAGIRGVSLPFDGSHAPGVRIAASADPFAVAGALLLWIGIHNFQSFAPSWKYVLFIAFGACLVTTCYLRPAAMQAVTAQNISSESDKAA
jgi:hypothetical protein